MDNWLLIKLMIDWLIAGQHEEDAWEGGSAW